MRMRSMIFLALLIVVGYSAVGGDEVAQLRLVPFPKEVTRQAGTCDLRAAVVLEMPAELGELPARLIALEWTRAGLKPPAVRMVDGPPRCIRLSGHPGPWPAAPIWREGVTAEDYALTVTADEILLQASDAPGLLYGVQTLCQLVRANRRNDHLPNLSIRDWPSLRWRCFQDDMTRGPSSTLPTLEYQVALGAHFKMNLFTYYMEYQYAFRKHPLIGPPDGSLEGEELERLVEFAKQHHVDVLGNQQSFGHFGRILQHEQYSHLREVPTLLTPVREETYQLLDDLYSEVCPRLPFPWFNVCCDETWGLGEGPSKSLAEQIGVGGVYVRHIQRVHDLLKRKHGKRMMMWGDIILEHPEHLASIPPDTIMLTWGYGPQEQFDDQIVPFIDAGFEFFVCPGISNWSRILPDFGVATTNIHHFVRDGTRRGALGMLNTAWEDDGEALQGYKWHGYAWGAECAWNGSATAPEDFQRRIGAVLFGESGDRFGQAITLLAETHRLADMQGMLNARFWRDDFLPQRSAGTVEQSAERLLTLVRPAIEHLRACQNEATFNRELLDYFLFGARRMEFIGVRMLDGLQAARLYNRAVDLPPDEAGPLLDQIQQLVSHTRDTYREFGRQFEELWLAESKPYGLSWTLDRYARTTQRYDEFLGKLAEARGGLLQGDPLPSPESLGLVLPEAFGRRVRATETRTALLNPDVAWADPSATHRFGVAVRAGQVDRQELPIEVEVNVPAVLASRPMRAFRYLKGAAPREILAQLDPTDAPDRQRLVFVLPERIPAEEEALVAIYLGLRESPDPLPGAVRTSDHAEGMKWIENDQVRLLLGPEGAHIYRWEVSALDGRDVTMPGETGWAGFADLASHRHDVHTLTCVSQGPALVRYDCATPHGPVKSIRLYGGVSWMEVMLTDLVDHYWNFDSPANFAADGPNPGSFLFANGDTGPVRPDGPFSETQVHADAVFWGIKYNDEKLALGLVTPEVAARHVIGPGSGAGGVGIERSTPAGHFVTFAGVLSDTPAVVMNRLQQTLDLRRQPAVVVYGMQARDSSAVSGD